MEAPEIVFEMFLKKKGMKLTAPRKLVLEGIYDSNDYFNVEELYYRLLEKNKGSVSKATIYRTIPLLVEAGLLKQSLHCQSKDQYTNIIGKNNFFNVICKNCGKIISVKKSKMESLLKNLLEVDDFEISEYSINIEGICKNCRR